MQTCEQEAGEESVEMSPEEKMARMQLQIDGLNAAVARLNECIEQLKRTGVLNKDPENPEGTYLRTDKTN